MAWIKSAARPRETAWVYADDSLTGAMGRSLLLFFRDGAIAGLVLGVLIGVAVLVGLGCAVLWAQIVHLPSYTIGPGHVAEMSEHGYTEVFAADAARETLAGAMAVAEQLGGALGDQVRLAAAHAFDSGVVVTSLVGAGLVVAAAVIAAATLSTRPHTSEESDVARHQIGTDPR